MEESSSRGDGFFGWASIRVGTNYCHGAVYRPADATHRCLETFFTTPYDPETILDVKEASLWLWSTHAYQPWPWPRSYRYSELVF